MNLNNKQNNNISKNENEEEKIEDKNDIGYFDKFYEENFSFEEFKYLLVDMKIIDIDNLNEINGNQLYNFLLKLKNENNIKIIIYINKFFFENEEYFKFIQISNIHIINNKNVLFEFLKNKKYKEEKKLNKEKKLIYRNVKINNYEIFCFFYIIQYFYPLIF